MDSIFLDLGDAIKGDSTIDGFKSKIEIMSFSHSVQMQVVNDVSNSQRTSGKPYLGEFSISKYVDSTTPTLNQHCCAGTEIKKATITCTRNSGEAKGAPMTFIKYILDNVYISSISVNGGGGDKPSESLSLNFSKIRWEKTTQASDGVKKGTSATSWNAETNKGETK